ncbi:2664_t:CDS:10 [Entrophospora sp. SA101]|nr:187_t:CDS:10 [Entrophospora sp. SA101]CAJ0828869.1 2664_t:CDS:10 [Entrophospora sp. SA101]
MSPPSSKNSGKNIETEIVLQAVVLADSFNERFHPITFDTPRCLMPLCNTPLIEYTLEFLAVAGVQEAYLFCREHAEKIRNYIEYASKWNRSYSPIKIFTIFTPEARSLGDVLREVDAKQLISSDFILISGDVVSNVHLEKVLKEASPFHRTRAVGESSIFAVDAQTKECLHYESVEVYPRKQHMVMDMSIFEKHSDVEIRNDLIDCQIDICSVEVPALFTENFDYEDIRKDFVYGILTSDILSKTIYCHIVEGTYAARVRGLQTYDTISNLQEGDSYEYLRGQIYKEKDVSLSRSCFLGEKVLIGAGTKIAENTEITNSVIGRRVSIGPNVNIDGAYIWDDVIIKSNCSITCSILTNNVILQENVTVNKGCILSHAYTKISRHSKKAVEDFDDDNDDNDNCEKNIDKNVDIDYDYSVIGENGKGYVWIEKFYGEEDDEDSLNTFRNAQVSSLDSESSISVISDGSSDEESDVDDHQQSNKENFSNEALQTLERAFSENHKVEDTLLELNTLRMAYNISIYDLRRVAIPTILSQINTEKLWQSTKNVLLGWGPLIDKLIQSKNDQLDSLYITQEYCLKDESYIKIFALSLRIFYEDDVIEEDAILEWYYSDKAKQAPSGKQDDLNKLRELEKHVTSSTSPTSLTCLTTTSVPTSFSSAGSTATDTPNAKNLSNAPSHDVDNVSNNNDFANDRGFGRV